MSTWEWLEQNEPPVDEDATQPGQTAAQSLWTLEQAARHLGVTPIIFKMFASGVGHVAAAGIELYYADAVIGIEDDPVAAALLAIIRNRQVQP